MHQWNAGEINRSLRQMGIQQVVKNDKKTIER